MQDFKTSLRDYIRIVFYWRWVIAILFFVIVATAIVGSFLWPPTYQGITTLLVEQPLENVVLSKPAYGRPAVPPSLSITEVREELAKTQSEIIKSRFLLGQVVDELSLDQDTLIKGPLKREKAINRLYKKVDVTLVRDTNLIRIIAEDKSAERSAAIANSIAQFYVVWAAEKRRTKAKGAYSFLGAQAEAVEKELRQLEDALQNLKQSKGVLALDEQTRSTVDQLGIFDTEYNKARSAEQEVSARIREIRNELSGQEEMIITSTDVTTNPIIDTLKIKLVDLELKLTDLQGKYTDDNPLVISVRQEIDQVKDKLTTEVARIFGTEITSTNPIYQDLVSRLIDLQTDLTALQAKRKALQTIRTDYANRLTNLSEAELEYTRLLRRIKGKEALYLTLLEKQGEAGLTEALEKALIVNVKVIDEAAIPVRPARPKKLLNSLLGVIIGLIVGIGGAFLCEYWDHSLKTVNQVMRFVDLPVLAVIPRIRAKRIVPYRVGTDIAESYNSFRTVLLRLCKEKSIKTILFASANNHEGKSSTAANLATSIAGLKEMKTLLIDMNLRRPALHRLFELSKYTNLSDVLRRKSGDMLAGVGDANLSVVTVGEIPEDPTRIFTSDEIKNLLREAKTRFDLVLLDSSSIIPSTDAAILAHEVDAIVLVIKAGTTKREVVERARYVLDVPPEKLIGCVLNSIEHVIPEKLYRRL